MQICRSSKSCKEQMYCRITLVSAVGRWCRLGLASAIYQFRTYRTTSCWDTTWTRPSEFKIGIVKLKRMSKLMKRGLRLLAKPERTYIGKSHETLWYFIRLWDFMILHETSLILCDTLMSHEISWYFVILLVPRETSWYSAIFLVYIRRLVSCSFIPFSPIACGYHCTAPLHHALLWPRRHTRFTSFHFKSLRARYLYPVKKVQKFY